MIKALWKKYVDSRDTKQLAEFQARDAELGTPTKETLNDRMIKAADKGHWKTALDAIDKGADIDARVKQEYSIVSNTQGGGYRFKSDLTIVFDAVKQDDTTALFKLLAKGADRFAAGFTSANGNRRDYTLIEYAVHNGAKNAAGFLLELDTKPPQDALDRALALAAREKSYNDLVEKLLKAGAQGFDGALRSAELNNNKDAIRMIRAAQATAASAPASANDNDAYERIEQILKQVPPQLRPGIVDTLSRKFGDAQLPEVEKTATPVAPAPKPLNAPKYDNDFMGE